MYERLYETMERYDADLSMAGLVFDYEDKNYPPRREGCLLYTSAIEYVR